MAKSLPTTPGMIRATALVTHAQAPPQTLFSALQSLRHYIVTVVDAGSGPHVVTVRFPGSVDRWLAPGEDIPVWVDPANPAGLLIDWASIPPIRERVARGDPAFIDPITGARRIAAATGRIPPGGDWANTPAEQRRAAVRAHLAARPVPAGRHRAHVFVVTKRPKSRGDGTENGTVMTTEVTSQTVLSVQPLDRAPYALFVDRFKVPRRRRDLISAGYPASVSDTDRTDIRVQWDEVAATTAQVNVRLGDALRQAQTLRAAAAQQQAAQQQAAAQQQWVAAQQSPQARAAIVANLRAQFAVLPDPAQRRMLLERYAALGVHITEEEVGG